MIINGFNGTNVGIFKSCVKSTLLDAKEIQMQFKYLVTLRVHFKRKKLCITNKTTKIVQCNYYCCGIVVVVVAAAAAGTGTDDARCCR